MDKCPHGNVVHKCDKCAEQVATFEKARRDGDTREVERQSNKMRRDHGRR